MSWKSPDCPAKVLIVLESTQSIIIPELVELTNDEETSVRLAGLETITNLLSLLDDGEGMNLFWSCKTTLQLDSAQKFL